MELAGATLVVGSVGMFVAAGVLAILGGQPPTLLGVTVGLPGLVALPTGWRLLMRPEDPRSPLVSALIDLLGRWSWRQ